MPRYGMEKIEAPRFIAGQRTTAELRRANVVAAYLLVLRFTFRVTGGSGIGAFFNDALFRLLKQVELISNGTARQVYSGQFLRLLQRMFGLEEYVQTPPDSLAAGDQADRKAFYFLPLQMPHSYTPEEFGLPSTLVKPEIATTWARPTEMVSGEDATALEIVDAQTELHEIPVIDPAQAPAAFQAMEIYQTEREISQSGDNIKIKLPGMIPGYEIRGVFVEALAGGADGEDYTYNDDLVGTVLLSINGREEFKQTPWDVLQNRNKVNYGLDALESGVVVFDSAEDRRTEIGELWPVRGQQEPYVQVNATKQAGECKVRVTVIATRRAAAPARRRVA